MQHAGSRRRFRIRWTLLLPALALVSTTTPLAVATAQPRAQSLYTINANDAAVAVVDSRTGTIRTTVALSQAPADVAIAPDGSRAYVVTRTADGGQLVAIDTATNAITATVPLFAPPARVAVNADGTLVYVTHPTAGSVSVFSASDRRVLGEIAVGAAPTGVAAASGGNRVFVAGAQGFLVASASLGGIIVDGIGSSTNLVLAPTLATAVGNFVYASGGDEQTFDASNLPDYGPPFTGSALAGYGGVVDVALSPDGMHAYYGGTNTLDGDTQAVVYIVDLATMTVAHVKNLYPCDGPAAHLALSPDGRILYVADSDGLVFALDGATGDGLSWTPQLGSCWADDHYLAIAHDGSRLYVGGGAGCALAVLDAASGALVATIPVRASAIGIADLPPPTASGSSGGCSVNPHARQQSSTVLLDLLAPLLVLALVRARCRSRKSAASRS